MSSAPASVSEPVAEPVSVPRHPLALPHFRSLLVGSTVSLLGDQFYLVALPWLVLQLTGSSLALGTMLMTAGVPRAALMLIGGAVTDRFSPRRVMMTTAATRTVLVGTVAALLWLHHIALWQLYVLTLAFGVADAFALPAGAAIIPALVPAQQLRPANALMQSTYVATQMLGPAPAGLIIKAWGVAWAFFLDALSFLAVIAALFSLPDRPKAPAAPAAADAPARPGMLDSIRQGLRFVWSDPPLLALMLVYSSINVCVMGPIGVGLPAMAKFRFGSAAAYGTMLSCFSGGSLVGILIGGLVKQPRRRGLQLMAMSAMAGLELVGMGLAWKVAVISGLLALMGLGIGIVNVQFSTWIQTRVESALLGRVMSLVMFAAIGLVPLSYAASGVVADWSLKALFVGAGGLLVAITLAMAIISRAAREID